MPNVHIKRILREPLFHFFLLGLGIFVLYASMNPSDPSASADERIVIDMQDIGRLVQQFEATWRRPPTQPELQGLVEALVREEVLVREAIVLGLDQGDGIIRSRLAQKMTFLTTSVAQSMLPEDEVLIAYMEANQDRFTMPGMLAFDQIALPSGADVDAALATLNAGTDPEVIGGRSLLPPNMNLSSSQAIDSTFGRGFYEALIELPENVWAGPVQSGYGAHLVRLTGRKEPALPPFEAIREQVLTDWRWDQTDTLTAAQLDAFRAKYEIETPSPEALAKWAVN